MDKRTFLRNLTTGTIASTSFLGIIEGMISEASAQSSDLSSNEDFWAKIRADYLLKDEYINLENGYYCMIPQPTLEGLIRNIREVNYQASYYMRTVRWDNKKKAAASLAKVVGCNEDELIVTRNTTESLDLIIGGYPWKAGDEAVMANQDYGAMLNMFKQVESRFRIVRKVIDVPMHPKSDEEIVKV